MRRRLLITVSLAILTLVVTAGAVSASGGQLLGTGTSSVGVTLSTGSLPTVTNLPQCSNLKDDDGDGRTDLADPDCSGPLDNSEAGTSGSGGGTSTGGGGGTSTGGGGTSTTTTGGTTTTGRHHRGGTSTTTTGSGRRGGYSGAAVSGRGRRGYSAGRENPKPSAPRQSYKPNGEPSRTNPTLTIATPAPAPLGVPSFIIDQFTIPPFLLPIYQACGTEYGIPWQVLAGINKIETNFGTNLSVSTAGAVGWMQFLPSTWKAYGVDANGDGRADPYNPFDAICAAARYLRAAGGDTNLRNAIFAYNHANWYVDEVLLYARQYGKLPDDLVASVTGLTEGDRFPVAARARYADDISARELARRAREHGRAAGNVADVISGSPTRRGINIYSHSGAPVVAVNDGVIVRMGHSKRLGKFVVLRDDYGNRFTYAELGSLAKVHPVPKHQKLTARSFRIVTPGKGAAKPPTQPASAGRQLPKASDAESEHAGAAKAARAAGAHAAPAAAAKRSRGLVNTEDLRPRLYALPKRPDNVERATLSGQLDQLLARRLPGYETVKRYLGGMLRFDARRMTLRPLEEGSRVVAGTVLGRIGKTGRLAPHVNFSIRPAGKNAPKIDPKPILDGWKLLEDTAIYRAAGKNPFAATSVSQALTASKQQLERQVLADPRLSIYACGRNDIRTGQIDQRVLAGMEYLADNGFRLTITALKCGHSKYTTSGYVSEHYYGDAMDIAAVNGIPIAGHQGRGSITEVVIQTLLRLQGTMQPHQIISLMNLGGPSFALPDHWDHIHVGWAPRPGDVGYRGGGSSTLRQFQSLLKPNQWQQLIGRIAQIENPTVPTEPSRYAIPTRKGAKRGRGD